MWQELNEFYLMVSERGSTRSLARGAQRRSTARVKRAGIYFEGVTDATLSRGEAWHFARLGRMLERADKTSRILDVKYFLLLPPGIGVGTTIDQLGWTALLNSASALQMYRQLHHVTSPANVAKFLLLHRDFPRSIQHCVLEAQRSLHALTGTPVGTHRSEAERSLGQLRASLDYADIEQIMKGGLHEYVDGLQIADQQHRRRHPDAVLRHQIIKKEGLIVAIRVALSHRTRYVYTRAVAMTPQVIRLRPAPHTRTPIHSYSLRIAPAKHFLNWQQDAYGNFLARVVVPEKTIAVRRHRGSRGRSRGVQPLRLLRRALRGEVSVRLPGEAAAGARAVLARRAGPRAPRAVRREARSFEPADGRLPRRNQSSGLRVRRVRHPARAGRADAGPDAVARARIVPGLELAARAGAQADGDRRAVRVGVL